MQPPAWAVALFLIFPVLAAALVVNTTFGGGQSPGNQAPAEGPFAPLSLPSTGPGSGQILVGFDAGALPSIGPGQNLAGMRVVARTPQLGLLTLQASDVVVARALLAVVPGVAYVEPDGAVVALDLPDDPHLASQYGPSMVGLPGAWDATGYGSDAVSVAVLDSGVLRSHPDLQGARLAAGYDYVNRDGTPNDDCGHGTHVLGIVGATTNNSLGIAGASQATMVPLKVLGTRCSGALSTIAQAIVDATDQGANIITMSLGTTTDSSTLAAAVRYAWDHDVVLVAAAGNGGSGGTVHYPAAYPQVIAVSALDSSKRLASYSSRGPQVEVAAPGSSVLSTTSSGGYGSMSGTSMAAPHVAGVLALALSCSPATTNQALRDALAATAEDVGPAGRDTSFGFGVARADRLVDELCDAVAPAPTPSTPPVANQAPTATFTTSASGLTLATDGRGSTDPDGDPLSYNWTFGDGATAAGPTGSHTYAASGTYVVGLVVSDGQLASSHNATVTVQATGFSAFFTPAKGCNEWWVEVAVSGNAPVGAVAAKVDGGTWKALPKTSWGSWAASFYVAKGSDVVFRATSVAGEDALSATYAWLGPPPAPSTGPFTAFFSPRAVGNDWWVETAVSASSPISKVEASVDSGAWTTLPATNWGTYAKSFHVPNGSQVTFRATSSAGATATSVPVTWT